MKYFKSLFFVFSILLTSIFIQGCDNEEYDTSLNEKNGTAPVMRSMDRMDRKSSALKYLEDKISLIDYNEVPKKTDITEELSQNALAWDNSFLYTEGDVSIVLVPFINSTDDNFKMLGQLNVDDKQIDFIVRMEKLLINKKTKPVLSVYNLDGSSFTGDRLLIDQHVLKQKGFSRLRSTEESSGSDQILTNNTNSVLWYTPETTMNIDGVQYYAGGTYALNPGQSTNVPIDGYSFQGGNYIYKVTDGYTSCTINDSYQCPDMNFRNVAYELVYYATGGWKGEDFMNDMHSKNPPYKGFDGIYEKAQQRY